jgi:tRNA threonylcarbamoyladenosine biosynthesis protein TsaE
MVVITKSAEETHELGFKLGKKLKGLDVVCLYGDLGAGKTTFVKGVAEGAGYKGRVTSPTFGLVRLYRTRKLTIYHLDLYRVGADATGDIGIEEFITDARGVCIVEWPEAGAAYWPKNRKDIRFEHVEGGRRIQL